MSMPNYPGRDEDPPAQARTPRRGRTALILAGVLMLIVIIALHLAGVFGP
ncbi:MAG TPA: hypothetical protein VHE83_16475 [Mycobacteriales bacterium]|nr:hypothetical protein [Mycobacteriales bacterium]